MKWLSSLRRDAADSTEGATQAEAAEALPAAETMRRLDSPGGGSVIESPEASKPDPDNLGSGAGTVENGDITSPPVPMPAGGVLNREVLQDVVAAALQASMQPLGEAQKALQEQFVSRIRSDEVQAKALETLHDDLKQYKANFVRQQMLPLLKEVIFCHDFVASQIERAVGDEANANGPTASALGATKQMLLDLLFKYDVEPYQGDGEQFDPKSQQCARTVPTGRAEADKTIAGRIQTGFRSPEGIVRREQVTVYKFTSGAE